MIVIGLTGGSGAGKSLVAKHLLSRGGAIIDCDAVYAELVDNPSECTAALSKVFGPNILTQNGTLDRPALSRIVFADGGKEKLSLLNATVHPIVISEVKKILTNLSAEGTPYAIIDAPQLFEARAEALCDTTVFVKANRELRASRIMQRDGLTRERALARINAQFSDDYFAERCEHCITNNATENELREQCTSLLDFLGIVDNGENE